MDLIRAGVDFQIRETFESAIVLGAKALGTLGVAPAEVADISARIRDRDDRDRERLQLELASGLQAGRALFSGKGGA